MKKIKITLFSVILAATFTSCMEDQPAFIERPTVAPPAPTENFASGADISGVTEYEAKGIKFYNKAGEEREVTALMKELGMNAIRLRVFVDPPSGLSAKADVVEKAMRAHALGMRLMIDFHYSDGFADPGKQNIPAAWADYNFNQMRKAVADHTIEILSAIKEKGIDVEWVQVGNETTNGMLWPMGDATLNMRNYAGLTQAGYDAVKSVYPKAQVIVHIDRGNIPALYTSIFDGLKRNNAKWDIIGMSLYPKGDWQTQVNDITANIIGLSERYGTPCMLVETGWERNEVEISKAYHTELFDKLMNDTKGYCRGILYWEPEAYTGTTYSAGAFTDDGRPSEALEPFNLELYK